ncbi:hypothetical protein BDR22DRAFT_22830 [Usnea florida]
MPCSISSTSAQRCLFTCTDAARTADLRVRCVGHSALKTSKQLSHTSAHSLQNQRIRRKIAAQTPLSPLASHHEWGSTKVREFFKSGSASKNNSSFDEDFLSEDVEGPRQSGKATYIWPKDLSRKKTAGFAKPADIKRKAWPRDYSEVNKETIPLSQSTRPSADLRTNPQKHKGRQEQWQIQKRALSKKFGTTGWSPRKRLSPDTLEGIQALHAQYPHRFTTPILAEQFKVSPEAIRRILKSKWQPKDEEKERRRQRWEKRGESIWSQMVEVGIKPPKKWREMGVGKKKMGAQGPQLGIQLKSNARETSSLLGEPTTNLRTIPANSYGFESPVPLADRIL